MPCFDHYGDFISNRVRTVNELPDYIAFGNSQQAGNSHLQATVSVVQLSLLVLLSVVPSCNHNFLFFEEIHVIITYELPMALGLRL